MRHNTVRQKAHVYRSLIAFMGGDAPACDITTRTISDYLTGIANSKNNITSNRHRRDLAALYAWGIRQGAVDVHPVAGIEPLPEDPAPRCIPPAADIASVRLAAMGDERDFLECIYHLAARRGEIVRMKWEDVNFEHSAVRLWTRKRRGGALQPDWVPMNDTLYGILRSRWKRRDKADPVVFALSSKALRNMMPKLCQQAGVKPFGFHAIRHHVASILNDSGKASMRQIQTILRHRRQATTEQYLHTVDHDIRRVAKILNGQSGTPGTHKKAAADGNDNR
jgi:integrase